MAYSFTKKIRSLLATSALTFTPALALADASSPELIQLREQLQKLLSRVQQLEQQQQVMPSSVAQDANQAQEKRSFTVQGNVLSVIQGVNGQGSNNGSHQGRMNYRGDVVVSVPVGSIGEAQGTVVGQLRFGQGTGAGLRPTHTGAVNSTAFETKAGSDETYAVLAQAYYQLNWPLDGGRFNDQAGSRVELTVGKMDLFGFFDQNDVAGDEGQAFLNNVFVHNPLLDSGGDITADAYGFAPGVRMGYFHEGETTGWGASLGIFAAGNGATFNASPGKPLVIGQLEMSTKQINGEPRGTYRLYAWTNGRTRDVLDMSPEKHTGIGISADQRIGREWHGFARIGRRIAGHGIFDTAWTLGFEHGGRAWGRSHDAVGVAVGSLKTSSAWRDATADTTLTGYAATGSESIAELYYRLKINDHLHLTPDIQWIRRAGGDPAAGTTRVYSLRANVSF